MKNIAAGTIAVGCLLSVDIALGQEGSGSMFSASASAEANEEGASADAETAAPEPEPEPYAEPEPPPRTTSVTSAPEAAAADTAAPGATDHSRYIGSFAIGYMGFRDLGTIPQAGTGPIIAPVIGARIWLDSLLGIDVGLGLSSVSGETEVEGGGATVTTDNPGPLAIALHGGVPLALADSEHFVFQVVPELNIGYGSITIEDGDDEDSGSVLHIDVGARAGAEIHFGFIDVPQLSLQAGVGLRFSSDSASFDDEEGGVTTTTSVSQTVLTTTVGDNPWNIFAANVAALYYFDK